MGGKGSGNVRRGRGMYRNGQPPIFFLKSMVTAILQTPTE